MKRHKSSHQIARGKRGRFLVFEGTEGSGKSTLIRGVARLLQDAAIPFVITREPGGSALAEEIRNCLVALREGEVPSAWCELFLLEAARAEHVERVIRPALAAGVMVLCDRFTDSTLAYQAGARGLPWANVKKVNAWATQGVRPDSVIWLDIDPKQGLKRVTDPNRFEAEGLEFHEKVRKGYLKARRECPKRWFTLNVNQGQGPQDLAQEVFDWIRRRFRC